MLSQSISKYLLESETRSEKLDQTQSFDYGHDRVRVDGWCRALKHACLVLAVQLDDCLFWPGRLLIDFLSEILSIICETSLAMVQTLEIQ